MADAPWPKYGAWECPKCGWSNYGERNVAHHEKYRAMHHHIGDWTLHIEHGRWNKKDEYVVHKARWEPGQRIHWENDPKANFLYQGTDPEEAFYVWRLWLKLLREER